MTDPVLNGSAEVPTYTSTASLIADGTFYDSGQYNCSAVVSPLSNYSEFVQNGSITSQNISGYHKKLFIIVAVFHSPCTVAI